MDGPKIIVLNEVKQGKPNVTWYRLYVESKKWYKWTYLQNRNSLTPIENKCTVNKRKNEVGKG